MSAGGLLKLGDFGVSKILNSTWQLAATAVRVLRARSFGLASFAHRIMAELWVACRLLCWFLCGLLECCWLLVRAC